MAEFSATANLEVRPTGMDAARREIERELGDIEVGVGASTTRPTGRQPRDRQTGQFMEQRGSEQRLVDLTELATERNDILQEILEEGGDGGGGFLRTAGAAGLGARAATGTGLGAATLAGGPFAALTAFTLASGAAASRTDIAGDLPDPPGPLVPGTRQEVPTEAEQTTRFGTRFGQELGGDPAGTTRPIPDEPPRAGAGPNIDIEANANVEAPSESLQRSEVQRFVQRRIRQAAEAIKSDLRRELGGDTNPRTTTRGGGGGATTGGRFRT